MTREWASFWLSIAAMVVAGTVATLSIRGLDIGSLGEWVSGLGALAAVVAALTIADRQRRDASAADAARSAEELERRRTIDMMMLETTAQALIHGLEACYILLRAVKAAGQDVKPSALMLIKFGRLDASSSAIDAVAVHDAFYAETVGVVMNAKVAWSMATHRAEVLADNDWKAGQVDILLNFKPAEDALVRVLTQIWRLAGRRPQGVKPTEDELRSIVAVMPRPHEASGTTPL